MKIVIQINGKKDLARSKERNKRSRPFKIVKIDKILQKYINKKRDKKDYIR